MRQTEVETWDRTLRICLTAPAFLAKWAAEVMEKQGFKVIPKEWWHFDYKDWKKYGILNKTFEELEKQ